MMPPRAQLTRRTPGFIFFICSIAIMPFVSFVSGMCTVMKSEFSMTSSNVATLTPSALARSSLI